MSESDRFLSPISVSDHVLVPVLKNMIRYKKCGKYIVTLMLLEDSKTNETRKTVDPVYAKYRTNKALVLDIFDIFLI